MTPPNYTNEAERMAREVFEKMPLFALTNEPNIKVLLEVIPLVELLKARDERDGGLAALKGEQHEVSPLASNIAFLKHTIDQLRAELEHAENRIDEEWLNAIATHWKQYAGKEWDTKDGECRQDGVISNVAAVFAELDAVNAQIVEHVMASQKLRNENALLKSKYEPTQSQDREADERILRQRDAR